MRLPSLLVIAGYVFAYGQTSSGKTHTMLGNALTPGVIPMALEHIFSTEIPNMVIRVSYLEIYNEQVRDLLDTKKGILDVYLDEKVRCFSTVSQSDYLLVFCLFLWFSMLLGSVFL